jgi:hypothetical protein
MEKNATLAAGVYFITYGLHKLMAPMATTFLMRVFKCGDIGFRGNNDAKPVLAVKNPQEFTGEMAKQGIGMTFYGYMLASFLIIGITTVTLGGVSFAMWGNSPNFSVLMITYAGLSFFFVFPYIPWPWCGEKCRARVSAKRPWSAITWPLANAIMMFLFASQFPMRADAEDVEDSLPFTAVNITYNASAYDPYPARSANHVNILRHILNNVFIYGMLAAFFEFLTALTIGTGGVKLPASQLFWAMGCAFTLVAGSSLILAYAFYDVQGRDVTHLFINEWLLGVTGICVLWTVFWYSLASREEGGYQFAPGLAIAADVGAKKDDDAEKATPTETTVLLGREGSTMSAASGASKRSIYS